jgi:hypothetical protein
MLPFLINKTDASPSGPVESIERKPDDSDDKDYDGLESAMEELHNAFLSKDYGSAADIFRSAQALLDKDSPDESLGDEDE